MMLGSPARHTHEDHGCTAVDLTPARQRILDLLRQEGRPLGAYELIDRLAAISPKRPAPMSVYRALDFLVDQGLVHRLASRNAFLACDHGHGASEPVVFLICTTCGAVAEATSQDMRASLDAAAAQAGFRAHARVIELTGDCAKCLAA